jgi:hypothetical protein
MTTHVSLDPINKKFLSALHFLFVFATGMGFTVRNRFASLPNSPSTTRPFARHRIPTGRRSSMDSTAMQKATGLQRGADCDRKTEDLLDVSDTESDDTIPALERKTERTQSLEEILKRLSQFSAGVNSLRPQNDGDKSESDRDSETPSHSDIASDRSRASGHTKGADSSRTLVESGQVSDDSRLVSDKSNKAGEGKMKSFF